MKKLEVPGSCGSVLVWRANPLPRARIVDDEFVQVLRQLATVEQELAELAQPCSEELYAEIGRSDEQRRFELLRLRRDIHNGRRISDSPRTLPTCSARWCELARLRDSLREEVVAGYGNAISVERATVLRMLADGDFQRGLALVAPSVYEAAVAYRKSFTAPQVNQAGRLRKSERGLLQYLSRAMTRTSPLSRFTAVGFAVAAADGVPLDSFRYPGADAVLYLDLAMTRYVAGGFLREDSGSWLMLAPSVRVGAAVEFVRCAGTQAQQVSAPLTDAMRALLELTAMGPRRTDRLTLALGERLKIAAERAAGLIESATRSGLLCAVGGPDSTLPPLPSEATGLLPDPSLASHLSALKHAAAASRRDRLSQVTELTNSLSRSVSRPARLTVNEDYVGPPATVSLNGCREALDDLSNTVEFLSMFDRMHVVRALACSSFVERFGPGTTVPLTEHARELVGAVYDRERSLTKENAVELGPSDGSLARLLELREHATAFAHEGIETAVKSGAPEAEWPSRTLADLTAQLPSRFRAEPLSYGVLTQSSGDDLVFNDAYAGNTMLYGRFLASDTAAGGSAAAAVASQLENWYGSDGAKVVEDRGLHGISLNHHQRVLPEGLDAEDWYSLRLAHDPAADLLFLQDGSGRKVRVLTLGVAMPELHPFPMRLANWLIAGGRLMRDFADSWAAGAEEAAVPRLRAGRVVFSRRRWYSAEFDQLAAAPELDDAQRLVELTRWRGKHGVSEQVMLKVPLRAGPGKPGAKPQYVDLASGLITRALPRMAARREAGYLEEALPGVETSAHAMEWIVEVFRRPGQRFGGHSVTAES